MQTGTQWWRTAGSHAACASALMIGLAACSESETSHDGPFHDHAGHAQRVVDGDPERGRTIIAAYACGVCHVIPGIRGAHGIVGPPLEHFAERQFIGGVVPNEPTILVRWVKDAPSIAPHTGMPDVGLSEEEARHVAAYLYTLR